MELLAKVDVSALCAPSNALRIVSIIVLCAGVRMVEWRSLPSEDAMPIPKCLLPILFALFLSAPAGARADATPAGVRYSVTVMGAAGTSANDINSLGAILGSYYTSESATRAFVNSGDGARDIGTLGGMSTFAARLNGAGQVVGSSSAASGQLHAFLFSAGVMNDLGTLGGNGGGASGINEAGYVAGYYVGPAPSDSPEAAPARAFVRTPGGAVQDIGTLPYPYPYARAIDVNNVGQVAGYSGPVGGVNEQVSFPFLYSGAGLINLGSIGGDYNTAAALNDLGEVVGSASLPGSVLRRHAFLYAHGVLVDIDGRAGDHYSDAFDINNLGQVVGSGDDGGGFLYEGGGMISLTELVDPSGGWRINAARGINDHGQIAATAVRGGLTYAVRLDPVPEPATVAMLAAGVALLCLRAARRRTRRS